MANPDSLLPKFGLFGWLGLYFLVVAVGTLLVWWLFRPQTKTLMAILQFATGLAFAGMGLYFVQSWMAQGKEWERMKTDGLQGTARVLQVESTNVTMNRRPQVRLRMAISVPDRPPYEVQSLEYVGIGQSVMPGRELTVYVDRNDAQHVVIDWNASLSPSTVAPAAAGPDTSKRLEDLKRLLDQGQITEDEYQAQRKRILSEL